MPCPHDLPQTPPLTHLIEHDLCEQHVLEHVHRLGIVQRVELLKRLKEVGVRSLVVALLRVQDTRLAVNLAAPDQGRKEEAQAAMMHQPGGQKL